MGLGGISHWIIILLIVLVLFGAGRVSGLMGELGKGIKSFKDGLNEGNDKPAEAKQIPPQQQQPIDITPRPAEPTATPPADDQTRS
jgi:sec-independent protein translocase protein TatA